MSPLQHYIKESEGKLRWTTAHPEKRNSMSANWSRDDCLNRVADRVAEGQVDFDIDCKYESLQVQAKNVMNSLVLPHSWMLNMKDETTPYTGRPSTANWQLETGHISAGKRQVQSCADPPKTTKMDRHNTSHINSSLCSTKVLTTTRIAQCQIDLGQALAHTQIIFLSHLIPVSDRILFITVLCVVFQWCHFLLLRVVMQKNI